MVCERCGGFLMVEQDYDDGLIASIPQVPAMRCVNCGNREDSLIRMNRALGSFAGAIRNAKRSVRYRVVS